MGNTHFSRTVYRDFSPEYTEARYPDSILASPGVQKNMSPADKEVHTLIRSHPVLIFAEANCPYSSAVRASIARAGDSVEDFRNAFVFEMDADVEEPLREAVQKRAGPGFPQVFVGGLFVGGCDRIHALERRGSALADVLRESEEDLARWNRRQEMLEDQCGMADRNCVRPPCEKSVWNNMYHMPQQIELIEESESRAEVITLGAGRFWGLELAMERMPEVLETEVGYSNGLFSPVTHNEVCTGRTAHAQVVRVWYMPGNDTLLRILNKWEDVHNVYSLNRQGNDCGSHYRSAIFWENTRQRDVALQWRTDAEMCGNKVFTDIDMVVGYSSAHEYHQKYLQKRGQSARKGASERIRFYG